MRIPTLVYILGDSKTIGSMILIKLVAYSCATSNAYKPTEPTSITLYVLIQTHQSEAESCFSSLHSIASQRPANYVMARA